MTTFRYDQLISPQNRFFYVWSAISIYKEFQNLFNILKNIINFKLSLFCLNINFLIIKKTKQKMEDKPIDNPALLEKLKEMEDIIISDEDTDDV